jgi:lipid-binding SYLF domain-containing protein
MKLRLLLLGILGFACIAWQPLSIAASEPASHVNVEDEMERARWSGEILGEILNAPDETITSELLEEAQAIAVIPHIIKGAYVVGGRYGKGLISHRKDNGEWSTPAYISLGGGSIGFQIGASSTDYILVFANEKGLKSLLNGKVELGADASVAAGPVGRTAHAATDITLNSEIYSYSRSRGAFAGIALDGAVLTIDDSANQKVYGEDYSAEEILFESKANANRVIRPFLDALNTKIPAEKP